MFPLVTKLQLGNPNPCEALLRIAGVAKQSFADKCVPKPGAWEREEGVSSWRSCDELQGGL